ncbi:MAG: tetratricopeptide repeat protein [Bdellovibrionales bacterium]
MKRLTRSLATLGLLLQLLACTSPQEADLKKAQDLIQDGHFRRAAQYLEQAIKRDEQSDTALKAMKEAARISFLEIKDYQKAAHYYQLIVRYSPEEPDRIEAQRQLASLYFESLQDYERAAVEYSKLSTSSRVDSERAFYKLSVARSYYYLGNYFQTLSEISEILKLKSDREVEFQARLLKGNVFVAQKKFDESAKIFQEVISKFPDKSLKENVHLVLSLSFEEKGDYKQALGVLEKIKDRYEPKEYLELRIKRIEERARNQPGARGYRK